MIFSLKIPKGKYYGVTDNAVRKWLKSYGLPTSIKVLRDEGLI